MNGTHNKEKKKKKESLVFFDGDTSTSDLVKKSVFTRTIVSRTLNINTILRNVRKSNSVYSKNLN